MNMSQEMFKSLIVQGNPLRTSRDRYNFNFCTLPYPSLPHRVHDTAGKVTPQVLLEVVDPLVVTRVKKNLFRFFMGITKALPYPDELFTLSEFFP